MKYLLLLLLCSCPDREALTREWQAQHREQIEQACERQCGHAHTLCLPGPHSSGACYQRYADCVRECR